MHFRKTFFFLLITLNFISCSSSYEFLSENSHNPKNDFSKYLLEEYRVQADFEAKEMHDWNSAKLYSEKALKAVDGIKIKPEKTNYWKLSSNDYLELNKAYDNLMQIYDSAISSNPYDLAVAISSLDCWSEQQEEGWQFWNIEECKNRYLKAMHNIYDTISNNENNKNNIKSNPQKENQTTNINQSSDTVVVVTKDKNKDIKQIIYFDFDKSILTDVNLLEIQMFLDNYKTQINEYLVVGHTDTKGSNHYNMNLSLDRAISVKNILIKYGIAKNKIKLLAKGEKSLTVQTGDEIAHPANRRAEILRIN